MSDMWVNFVFTQQQRSMAIFPNRMVHTHILITLYAELWMPIFLIGELEGEDQFHDKREVLTYLQWISASGIVLSVSSAAKPDQCSGLKMKNYSGVTVLPYCVFFD
jgi:hypothetical protein